MDEFVLNTPKGTLKIELFRREAPLASQCFIEQYRTHVWHNAQFYRAEPSALYFGVLGESSFVPHESHHRISFAKRGMVAYSPGTTSELLFSRGDATGKESITGTVFGCVTAESVYVLESIASGPKNGADLVYPIGLAAVKPTSPKPERKRRRFQLILKEESDEDELPKPTKKQPAALQAWDLPRDLSKSSPSAGHSEETPSAPLKSSAAVDPELKAVKSRPRVVSLELQQLLDFEKRLQAYRTGS